MKKCNYLKLFSLTLVIVMLLGAFAACGKKDGDTTQTEAPGSSSTETNVDTTETPGSSSTESSTTEINVDTTESEGIDLSNNEYSSTIILSNTLKNGVNAYFTDDGRSKFALDNMNMSLEYALCAGMSQRIASLTNTKGNAYITDTSDVFVKLTNGRTFYASKSTKPATANLYRFGYYMYEARLEEQNFLGDYTLDGAVSIDISSVSGKQVRVTYNEETGTQLVTMTGDSNNDPNVSFKNISFTADDYPYIAITMRADIRSARYANLYVETDDHELASVSSSIIITGSDEYVTYVFPVHMTSWYTGHVKGLRIDFAENGKRFETYEIKDVLLLKGNTEDIPANLGLARSFYVYSDKLHQVIQIASADTPTEGIASVGIETKIAKNTVSKAVVKDKNGTHYSFDSVDWDSAEYVGFDVTDAGIFGYILPAGNTTDKLEVVDDGVNYVIIQSRTPENGTIKNSGVLNSSTKKYEAVEGVNDNANDIFMGQRLYTDESHDFEKFLLEAEIERNPLTDKNFIINKRDSSYTCSYECPECGKTYQEYFSQCEKCEAEVTPIEHPSLYFVGYNSLRGIYSIYVPGEYFNGPYFQYPNKYINASFAIRGDQYDRNIYLMTESTAECLECAVVLDENMMLLPIPVEVGKNFSEPNGERSLWNIQDNGYSEAIVPINVKADSKLVYTILNLYQNWGQYPLKQISWIQYGAPYYHLSTGVTETNCIVPYYSCRNNRARGTLPDHRAMSAHLWSGQPQHTSGGNHTWLTYTDSDNKFSASENTLDYIDSYGPIYADVYMDYISDDGKIKVSYTHMEFPQIDENRAYYEMKYEVLDDVIFKNFSKNFNFYSVGDSDDKGTYKKVGYLNEENVPTIAAAATGNESFKYTLGTECPYFSFFDMPDYNQNSTSAEGFVNLSFLIYNYEIIINGEKSDVKFVIVNENNRIRLSLDLGEITLKKGDTFTINAIVMPWGDETLNYDEIGDKNVRDVRVNTLLNPLTPIAVENCEIIESVFLPKIKSTNGKNATFTLTGGQNNVAVRVYGFNKLTVPKIQELVDGEWVDYQVSSAYKPDKFGNAHYYDGYSVYYDEDGTCSYAFIVPMDYTDADGRTFRVSAEEDFDHWPRQLPEIESDGTELPMNVFVDADEIMEAAQSQAGKKFGGIVKSNDGSYVTLSSNSKVAEAYFNIWQGDGGKTVTGQYLVLKYRLPETNNKAHTYFEYFTKTDASIDNSQACFGISNALIWDGQWHTLVVDVSSWNNECFVATNDEYKAQFVRIDLFNDKYPDGNSIDIEFFGMSDDIDEILAYYSVDTIQVLTNKNNIVSYDKQGNKIDSSSGEEPKAPEGFTKYLDATEISSAIKKGTHSGGTVISSDKTYVTLSLDVANNKVESYFNLFSGNTDVTGQYLIIKYRTSSSLGYMEIYASTEVDGAGDAQNLGGYFAPDSGKGLYLKDGDWHVIAIDLSEAMKDTAFAANGEGKYVAKFVRLDLFNVSKSNTEECSIDIAYIGMCDSYEDAICHSETTLLYDTALKVVTNNGTVIDPNVPGQGGSTDDDVNKRKVYFNIDQLGDKVAGRFSDVVVLAEGHAKYPVGGFTTDATTLGKLYFSGWIGTYEDISSLVFRVTDESGNVSDWITFEKNGSTAIVRETTDSGIINAVTNNLGADAYRHRIGGWMDLNDYAGQTVKVEIAIVLKDVPTEQQYFTIITAENVHVTN